MNLRYDQHPNAELRHNHRRLRTDRGGIETLLRVGDRPWPDAHFRDFVELSVVGKPLLGERGDDDPRYLLKADARFVHGNAEAVVLDRRGAATKAEDRPPAG